MEYVPTQPKKKRATFPVLEGKFSQAKERKEYKRT